MNPQGGNYNPQGGSAGILLQGTSPNLQASPYSGLSVQPAYQPTLNQSGSGGVPLSSSRGGYQAPVGTQNYAGTSGGTASTPAAPAYTVGVNDPATLALYNQQIAQYNQAIGQLPTQLQGAQNQTQSAYNNAYNQLLGQKNQATSSYNTSTTGNKQNFLTNKNTIGTNAGQSLNGLLRLLGSRGAGGSSAALFAAPQAVAQNATQQRSAAGQTYGANQAGLDTTYNNYLTQNSNDVNGIQSQRDQSLNSAQQQIAQENAGLQQELATIKAQLAAATGGDATGAAAPYLGAAQNYLNSANQLGLKTFTPTYNTAAYAAPSPQSYALNPFATPQSSNPNAGVLNNTVTPALTALLNKQQTALSGVPV